MVNLSLTATHSQNNNTNAINMTLPTFQGSMERIFPFASREGIKKGLIQNINFQYNVNARNSIVTSQENFFKKEMFDEAKFGARHSIPISTNFKLAKYFSVSMGANYEDVWTMNTFRKAAVGESNQVTVIDTINGFDRYGTYNFNASIGTTVYGTFDRGEEKKLQALRHVVRPSISYSNAPSFEQYYEDLYDEDGDMVLDRNGEVVRYSRFEGTLNGAPGLNKSSTMSFSLQNTLEAKVRDKDSTKLEPKKITLLNSLNFSSSYNFLADSLKLSPVRFSGGTNIFNRKMTVNFGGSLDPYAIDNNGNRLNVLNVNNNGGLFRLTAANMNISYSISNETFKKKKDDDDEDPVNTEADFYTASSGGRTDDLFGRADNFGGPPGGSSNEDVENPPYASKLPWNIRLALASTYNNRNRQQEFTNNSLMFSGDIQLSPRWKVGGSSGYDFKNQGFTMTQLRFERDLKSFVMRFNWTPFGRYERWYFYIGIKSGLLSDLKWENRSQR
jgi:hypothetical protein